MRRIKYSIFILLVVGTNVCTLFGQRLVTGRVIDKDSGSPIKEATITLIGTTFETKTNVLGFFQVKVDIVNEITIVSQDYPPMQTNIPSDVNSFIIKLVKQTNLQTQEKVFVEIDESATFPSGMPGFYNYVSKNLKYPKTAKKKGITGRVYVEFIVERDGAINKESVRALTAKEVSEFLPNTSNIIQDEECELEAVRLVQESPIWNPGKIKSIPARQKMVLPIIFR
jgi:hypothetical protein